MKTLILLDRSHDKKMAAENDFQTPVKKRTVVPHGHILVSGKWRKSLLTKRLQGKFNCVFHRQMCARVTCVRH